MKRVNPTKSPWSRVIAMLNFGLNARRVGKMDYSKLIGGVMAPGASQYLIGKRYQNQQSDMIMGGTTSWRAESMKSIA